MGVPKFFRYMSERYPCLSEVVKEYQIPEFDNLYLDMNGIIHMCSHPDDNNPHFRITEEKIFSDIFHYIEILFRMIKPQKLFFMAVDGVAPRAKMNQQRGRRFRSAKEADKMEKDAKKKGEVLPEAARFDSNCITPGTEFMAHLQEQLKYFVVQKISNDKMWKKCKVILSGHETPGEGEHKIMDYIRYMRAQPNYDPNTRHCLYGLDADLIMLGLCTHEPHFSLLREEVKFGKKSTKRNSVPEDITFYLLHLSLMREYLELEFFPIKEKLDSFEYDFEKIIDDWVLMGFLVGNDFIPHLPNLHISEGALPILYKTYMNVLPELGGYINEAGTLNLERFEHFCQTLSKLDHENFEDYKEDAAYMENKTGKKLVAHTKVSTKTVEKENPVKLSSNLSEFAARKLQECLDELGLDSDDSESEDEFTNYKREYYMNKMEFNKVTPEVMQSQASGYVRAIQWNLNYYYNGCCSWSWYYPHHYAPYISDIKGFSQMKIDFDRGKPFLPFEQLLAVLPAASKNLLPVSYHDLMTGENSHIKQYYPEDFQTDLNGKKQEWEAVVLVPFIDEDVLLEAMKPCNELLTEEEKNRNKHGPMLVYTYTEDDMGSYKAPEYFPMIASNHAKCEPVDIKSLIVPEDKLIKGAYPGVKLDVYYPGFPTMKHLEYTADVRKAHVRVFEQPSRNDSMILKPKQTKIKNAETLLGKNIWVQWPHLIEAKVVSVIGIPDDSGDMLSHFYFDKDGASHSNILREKEYNLYHQRIQALKESNMKRWGIDYNDVRVLVEVQEMVGRKYIITSHGRVNLEKQFAIGTSTYPLEGIVTDIKVYSEEDVGFKDVSSVFPIGSPCFVLTRMHYGSMGTVLDNDIAKKDGRLQITVDISERQDLHFFRDKLDEAMKSYRTAYAHSNSMSISQNVFSRLTGAVIVFEDANKTINIGLNLKHNKGNLETPGYTRKVNQTWLYSQKTSDLMREYSVKFPEVLAYLTRNPDADFTPRKIFGNDWESKMKELTSWLKSLPSYRAERRVCGSEALDPDFVNELAEFIKDREDKTEAISFSVKPQFLYNPYLQVGNVLPDNTTKSYLFDWIVNVREGYTVPLGLKGVIIAIHKPLNDKEMDINYDVLFIKPFAGGFAVNNSDEQRCYRLPRMAFINISHGYREFRNKIERAVCNETNSRFPGAGAHNFSNQSQSYISPTRQNNNSQSAFASFSGNKRCRINQTAGPEQKSKGYQGNRNPPNQISNVQNNSSYPMNLKWGQPVFFQGHAPNSRSVNNYTPKVNNHTGTNSFMPQFSKTRTVQNVNLSKGKFSHNREPTTEDAADPSQHSELKEPIEARTNQVDSDFLKRLLKINVDSNDKIKKSEQVQIPNMEIKKTENAASFEKKHKKSPESGATKMFANSSFKMDHENKTLQSNVEHTGVAQGQISASVQLLNYFHSIGLGMPRFQYYTINNRRVAQVVLPDKTIATGMAVDTNSDEEATEKAAMNALQIIAQKNQSVNTTISVNKIQVPPIPVPPQQWVKSLPEDNKQNSKDKSLTGSTKTFQKSKENVKRTKSKSPSFKVATDFVPLQVIKKAQKNSSNENQKSDMEKVPDDSSKEETNIDSSKDKTEQTKDKARKPVQRRKMRLAVNFQN